LGTSKNFSFSKPATKEGNSRKESQGVSKNPTEVFEAPHNAINKEYQSMKRSITAIVMVFLLCLGAVSAAQDKPLAVTENKPVVDGTVNPGEYSFAKDFGDLTLYLDRSPDTLYSAVVGKTGGWVAVGLGSLKMDGATIFMGFVDSAGKVQFKPQEGAGHTHHDTGPDVSSTISAYAMKESGGVTTLEIALKAAEYIKAGQDSLDTIFAMGSSDSFSPHHMYRNSMSVKLLN
jgi:hypothetical protein